MDYEKKYNEILAWAKKYKARLNGVPIEEIFPELNESEDERIRKNLIELLLDTPAQDIISHHLELSKVLAYLEKQKNLKYSEEQLEDIRQYAYNKSIVDAEEKQKEQKPKQSEDEKEYVRTLKSLISDFLRGKDEIDRGYYQKIYDWLDGRHIEQQSAEWSEGDEGMLNCIIATLCEESHGGREVNDKMVAWLDNRLRILRPQPHWKPSKEQMEALNALNCHGTLSYMGQQEHLISLYNDIKKL